MTFQKTYDSLKNIVGEIRSPKVLERYKATFLTWKDEILDSVIQGLNLPEDQREYITLFLDDLYRSLVEGNVELFLSDRYERGRSSVLQNVSLDVDVFIVAELLVNLVERILRHVDREDAVELVRYLIRASVVSIAFARSAYNDLEVGFLGITNSLMERIRKFGAEESEEA